jgi:endoglucanase
MAGMFVDPTSDAMQAYQRLQGTDPGRAALIYQIASQPQAVWLYGDGNGLTRAQQAVDQAMSAGAYPIFVPFTLLAVTPPDYPTWTIPFAQAISVIDSAVILEPNVLPERGVSDCSKAIADSIPTLKAAGRTRVYLDAGHAAWRPAAQMADILNNSGIANADGFSINIGNFRSTAECIAYGEAISPWVGNKPYVIDTGRNGRGPINDTDICNPPGRARLQSAVGPRPRPPCAARRLSLGQAARRVGRRRSGLQRRAAAWPVVGGVRGRARDQSAEPADIGWCTGPARPARRACLIRLDGRR